MSQHIVLGIETSCDETAVGIVRGRTLLANVIASSVQEHARFGGVVPEIASRAHLEAMQPTIEKALKDSKLSLNDIDAIAVTAGPGLVGALLVGVGVGRGAEQAKAVNQDRIGADGHMGSTEVDRQSEARMRGLIRSRGKETIRKK